MEKRMTIDTLVAHCLCEDWESAREVFSELEESELTPVIEALLQSCEK